jgi:hypothetical protein
MLALPSMPLEDRNFEDGGPPTVFAGSPSKQHPEVSSTSARSASPRISTQRRRTAEVFSEEDSASSNL